MIIVYGKEDCKYCTMAKQLLREHKFPFETSFPGKEKVQSLKGETGHKTFPFIFDDKKFIGGYAELRVFVSTRCIDF